MTEHTINRLISEALVRKALSKIHEEECGAQKHADYLETPSAKMPVVDGEVTRYWDSYEQFHAHVRRANHARKQLAKAVEFYLGTY